MNWKAVTSKMSKAKEEQGITNGSLTMLGIQPWPSIYTLLLALCEDQTPGKISRDFWTVHIQRGRIPHSSLCLRVFDFGCKVANVLHLSRRG
jgi:hypothetical protein